MKESFAECNTIKVNQNQLNKHEILLKLTCFSNTSVARQSLNSPVLHIANKIPRPAQNKTKMFLMSKLHKRLSTQDCFVPQGFSRILKASSTVIKHNKLQQFYINTGERVRTESAASQFQRLKPNNLKPNLPTRKAKLKRSSLFMQKQQKFKDSISYRSKHRKTITSQGKSYSNGLQSDDICIKKANVAQILIKRDYYKRSSKMSNLFKISKESRREDKENIEFDVQPWANGEIEDVCFY